MSDTSLIFNLFAIDKASEKILGVKSAFGKLAIGAAASAALFADKSIQMAGDFEASQLRLVTTAGESQAALKGVSDGVLAMAGPVGVSASELSRALYTVESAGYHGADGLKVLEAASKGAKIEGADVKEVADAVSSALNDYHMPASQAAEVTNTLVAAVGRGKTTMGELAAAMPNVMSAASTAKVSFQEAAAALATMTMHGTDASTAGTYLRQVILGLENPSVKARGVMQSLGLDANQVSLNLGKNGLASTISMLEDAIKNHLSPAGLVAVEALKKSAGSTTDFQKALANLPSGQKTAIGALADMVGGVKNLQGFLQLGGENLKVFEGNTAAVKDQVAKGGKEIDGWSKYQETFNYKLASAKASMGALTIEIGNKLLPVAKQMIDSTMSGVKWFGEHKTVTKDLATVVGVLGGALLAYKGYVLAAEAATKLKIITLGIWKGLQMAVRGATMAWAAAQWVLNAAMDANPIGLIIIAVAALAVGIWYLWNHSSAFRNFFIGLWHDIWGVLKPIGSWFAGPFASFFVQAWHVIADAALWLWHNVLDPVWQGIKIGVDFVTNIVVSFANLFAYLWMKTVADPALWFWHNIMEPMFKGIGASALWLWHNVLVPFGLGIADVAKGVASVAMWLWHNAIVPAFHGIEDAASAVGGAAKWLWRNAIEPAFHGIGEAGKWAWENVLRPTFNAVMSVVHTVGDVFRSVFSAVGGYIKSGFSGAVSFVKGVINDLIYVVDSAIGGINDVINLANQVPGVSFPHIPRIPYLAEGGVLTRGGLVTVGERGAETVALPTGAAVYPHGSGPAPERGPQVVEMRVAGGADSALATFLHGLQRAGILQFALVN